MDGHAERFAENVPAGYLDRGDRGAVDVAAVERDAIQHLPGDSIDSTRVLADNKMLELTNRCFRGANEAVQSALAEAGDAQIGLDADEQPILPTGADGEGLNAGNSHAL